jgi:hypothetical protein
MHRARRKTWKCSDDADADGSIPLEQGFGMEKWMGFGTDRNSRSARLLSILDLEIAAK